jgi:hypothetical protein
VYFVCRPEYVSPHSPEDVGARFVCLVVQAAAGANLGLVDHSFRQCSRGKALKANRSSLVSRRAAATSGNWSSSIVVRISNASLIALLSRLLVAAPSGGTVSS